jgi:hypothetical protein
MRSAIVALAVIGCHAGTQSQHPKPIENAAPASSADTVAVALVVNEQEIWIGNLDVETDENARYAGALKLLEAAIDTSKLAAAGGPGSKAVVVSYGTGARVLVPALDLDKLRGIALGDEKDYRGKYGSDLVEGIMVAEAELSKLPAVRKAIIVIGDGNDTNNAAARTQLRVIAADLKKQDIQIFAIIFKDAVSSETDVLGAITPGAKHATNGEALASELAAIAARLR